MCFVMGTPIFDGLKQQASFYLKEKIRSARLVLTDVTPVQLLVEEVTSGKPWSPDAKTMGLISRSAFDCDEYIRIIHILHRRLSSFEWENWREAYNSLVLLEHLLTRGPESIAIEFQGESSIIEEMLALQYIDEKGFNWGLAVKNKAERVLKLLKGGTFLKEERERARRLAQGIKGFGSLNRYLTSTDNEPNIFRRCNSQYENYTGEKREYSNQRDEEEIRFLQIIG
ncbi:ENTH/VHS family protein [Rhynchospora pubera]|uniref:ENTH/VHS family protein n=1 Tax=Rhynchospora pubera TaxID=906938 RepID=A0AAV8DDJ1_9POAL|nr:ENTH/VHS family protein [Rhynchospora pubera]